MNCRVLARKSGVTRACGSARRSGAMPGAAVFVWGMWLGCVGLEGDSLACEAFEVADEGATTALGGVSGLVVVLAEVLVVGVRVG